MSFLDLCGRLRSRYRQCASRFSFKWPPVIEGDLSTILSAFDDFLRSTLPVGGRILKSRGAAGIYYAALGLMGRAEDTGSVFDLDCLRLVVREGHELGCHTSHHCQSWETEVGKFEALIIENNQALKEISPNTMFRTFLCPVSAPRRLTKPRAAKHFVCRRSGGQTVNARIAEINSLRAYFLDAGRINPAKAKEST